MKKTTKKKKKGFTLIELLIVIAIIGILASIVLVSLNGARTKAKIAGFKSTANSLNASLVTCCSNETANINPYVAGQEVCSVPVGSLWPSGISFKLASDPTVTIVQDCATTDFNVTIAPAAGDATLPAVCNADTTLTHTGTAFPAGC